MNLLITFREFLKDPKTGILFLALVSTAYLYFDNKMVYENQIQRLESRVHVLEGQVEKLQGLLLETTKTIEQ